MWHQSWPDTGSWPHLSSGQEWLTAHKSTEKENRTDFETPNRLKYLQAIFEQIFFFLLDTVDVHLHLPRTVQPRTVCTLRTDTATEA